MNSWGSGRLEERIDEMLTSSVSSGSEPAGYRVQLTLRKPAFPWNKVLTVLTAAVILGFFALEWFNGARVDGLEELLSPGSLRGALPGTGDEGVIPILAILVGLGGTIAAFLSDRNRTLRRML